MKQPEPPFWVLPNIDEPESSDDRPAEDFLKRFVVFALKDRETFLTSLVMDSPPVVESLFVLMAGLRSDASLCHFLGLEAWTGWFDLSMMKYTRVSVPSDSGTLWGLISKPIRADRQTWGTEPVTGAERQETMNLLTSPNVRKNVV